MQLTFFMLTVSLGISEWIQLDDHDFMQIEYLILYPLQENTKNTNTTSKSYLPCVGVRNGTAKEVK